MKDWAVAFLAAAALVAMVIWFAKFAIEIVRW